VDSEVGRIADLNFLADQSEQFLAFSRLSRDRVNIGKPPEATCEQAGNDDSRESMLRIG